MNILEGSAHPRPITTGYIGNKADARLSFDRVVS